MAQLGSDLRLPSAQVHEEHLMHPCEFIQRSGHQQEEALRYHRIRTTHGLGAASAVGLAEATLLGGQRLGAMPSSNVLYHSYRGTLTEIYPEDLYGRAEDNPFVQPSSRALAEKAVYGRELTVKNVCL